MPFMEIPSKQMCLENVIKLMGLFVTLNQTIVQGNPLKSKYFAIETVTAH